MESVTVGVVLNEDRSASFKMGRSLNDDSIWFLEDGIVHVGLKKKGGILTRFIVLANGDLHQTFSLGPDGSEIIMKNKSEHEKILRDHILKKRPLAKSP